MKSKTEKKPAIPHDEIAALANQIWLAEGAQCGRDEEYWLKAEQQLQAARSPGKGPAKSAVTRPVNTLFGRAISASM